MKAKMGAWIGRGAALVGLMVLGTGCAHYQYSLLQPGNGPQIIGKQPLRVEYAPLTYQVAERNHRLAMQIDNPTDTPVRLLAERSYLVTPRGETRPMPAAVIAPHSYIGITFPPPPLVYRSYPTYSWGMGFGPYWGGPYWNASWGFYGAPYGPMDYYVTPPQSWDWKEGNVRMLLFYQQATNIIEHQFLFNREKVKK